MATPTPGHARRVVVIALGGTIAMAPADTGGVTPSLSADELLAAVPGLTGTGIDVDAVTLRARPGASLTVADLRELLTVVDQHLDAGATGTVVTQGTDTIEETAYALDLLYRHAAPLVVTGAMRHPTMAGADGPANLLAALTVAADPGSRDLGCLVVLNDEIHAAARVRKTHATNVATFRSPNGGPLGYLVEGHPRYVNVPVAPRRVLPTPAGPPPRVGLYTATLDDDPHLLVVLGGHCAGLVVAGFGVGHVPDTWTDALHQLAVRIPVVLASRTGQGPTLTGTYGYVGSERDLLGRGLLGAGFLHPYKARILLALALAAGADRPQLTDAFAAASGTGPDDRWPWPPSEHLARGHGGS